MKWLPSWNHFNTLLRDNDVMLVVSSNCALIISNFNVIYTHFVGVSTDTLTLLVASGFLQNGATIWVLLLSFQESPEGIKMYKYNKASLY